MSCPLCALSEAFSRPLKRLSARLLAGVLHAGGDALDADDHRVPQLAGHVALAAPQPLEHLRLDGVRGVQVGLPHADRHLQVRLVTQQGLRALHLPLSTT